MESRTKQTKEAAASCDCQRSSCLSLLVSVVACAFVVSYGPRDLNTSLRHVRQATLSVLVVLHRWHPQLSSSALSEDHRVGCAPAPWPPEMINAGSRLPPPMPTQARLQAVGAELLTSPLEQPASQPVMPGATTAKETTLKQVVDSVTDSVTDRATDSVTPPAQTPSGGTRSLIFAGAGDDLYSRPVSRTRAPNRAPCARGTFSCPPVRCRRAAIPSRRTILRAGVSTLAATCSRRGIVRSRASRRPTRPDKARDGDYDWLLRLRTLIEHSDLTVHSKLGVDRSRVVRAAPAAAMQLLDAPFVAAAHLLGRAFRSNTDGDGPSQPTMPVDVTEPVDSPAAFWKDLDLRARDVHSASRSSPRTLRENPYLKTPSRRLTSESDSSLTLSDDDAVSSASLEEFLNNADVESDYESDLGALESGRSSTPAWLRDAADVAAALPPLGALPLPSPLSSESVSKSSSDDSLPDSLVSAVLVRYTASLMWLVDMWGPPDGPRPVHIDTSTDGSVKAQQKGGLGALNGRDYFGSSWGPTSSPSPAWSPARSPRLAERPSLGSPRPAERPSLAVDARAAIGSTAINTAPAALHASVVRALCLQRLPCVRAWLALGGSVHGADHTGSQCLHYAVMGPFDEAVDLLLVHGAPVDARVASGDGATPLLLASTRADPTTLLRLLAAGADPNRADARGHTPIMMCSRLGHVDHVRCLLDAGASLECKDDEQRTAHWYANKYEHHAVVMVLRQHRFRAGVTATATSLRDAADLLSSCRRPEQTASSLTLTPPSSCGSPARLSVQPPVRGLCFGD